jgi:hypothetical protein
VLQRLAALADDARDEAVALRTVLDRRHLGPATQQTLAALVDTARGIGRPPLPDAVEPADPVDRDAVLVELYRWYKDWSATARAVLPSRKDHIRLGIARKRTGGAAKAEPAPTNA